MSEIGKVLVYSAVIIFAVYALFMLGSSLKFRVGLRYKLVIAYLLAGALLVSSVVVYCGRPDSSSVPGNRKVARKKVETTRASVLATCSRCPAVQSCKPLKKKVVSTARRLALCNACVDSKSANSGIHLYRCVIVNRCPDTWIIGVSTVIRKVWPGWRGRDFSVLRSLVWDLTFLGGLSPDAPGNELRTKRHFQHLKQYVHVTVASARLHSRPLRSKTARLLVRCNFMTHGRVWDLLNVRTRLKYVGTLVKAVRIVSRYYPKHTCKDIAQLDSLLVQFYKKHRKKSK